ncbi:hypothetical protein HELRODRAFT_170711 [Helobdella robusta]|uniref:G-protein coupled receptors family 1 profile domain-containing protein n=1 Tax=Helobdella robusta TaxID=6412 RepID=T1F3C3_HELRO|nr:hypothetical protein HELRODRAFT_170711 [Helobdella robusta]ESO07375.1 hypothetical protein HELRODRAFT_170711 [Helobdella robusta]
MIMIDGPNLSLDPTANTDRYFARTFLINKNTASNFNNSGNKTSELYNKISNKTGNNNTRTSNNINNSDNNKVSNISVSIIIDNKAYNYYKISIFTNSNNNINVFDKNGNNISSNNNNSSNNNTNNNTNNNNNSHSATNGRPQTPLRDRQHHENADRGDTTLNKLTMASNLCIMFSYPLNFFIYCTMSKKFKTTFKELALSSCCGCGKRCGFCRHCGSGCRSLSCGSGGCCLSGCNNKSKKRVRDSRGNECASKKRLLLL